MKQLSSKPFRRLQEFFPRIRALPPGCCASATATNSNNNHEGWASARHFGLTQCPTIASTCTGSRRTGDRPFSSFARYAWPMPASGRNSESVCSGPPYLLADRGRCPQARRSIMAPSATTAFRLPAFSPHGSHNQAVSSVYRTFSSAQQPANSGDRNSPQPADLGGADPLSPLGKRTASRSLDQTQAARDGNQRNSRTDKGRSTEPRTPL
jgi:hypothetical protein